MGKLVRGKGIVAGVNSESKDCVARMTNAIATIFSGFWHILATKQN